MSTSRNKLKASRSFVKSTALFLLEQILKLVPGRKRRLKEKQEALRKANALKMNSVAAKSCIEVSSDSKSVFKDTQNTREETDEEHFNNIMSSLNIDLNYTEMAHMLQKVTINPSDVTSGHLYYMSSTVKPPVLAEVSFQALLRTFMDKRVNSKSIRVLDRDRELCNDEYCVSFQHIKFNNDKNIMYRKRIREVKKKDSLFINGEVDIGAWKRIPISTATYQMKKDSRSLCECEKVTYVSEGQAITARDTYRKEARVKSRNSSIESINHYKCYLCKFFHITTHYDKKYQKKHSKVSAAD